MISNEFSHQNIISNEFSRQNIISNEFDADKIAFFVKTRIQINLLNFSCQKQNQNYFSGFLLSKRNFDFKKYFKY